MFYWFAELPEGGSTVSIKEECTNVLEEIYSIGHEVAVNVDPYPSPVLTGNTIKKLIPVIKKRLTCRYKIVENKVSEKLKVNKVPIWAENFMKKAIKDDLMYQKLEEIYILCVRAAEENKEIFIIGD